MNRFWFWLGMTLLKRLLRKADIIEKQKIKDNMHVILTKGDTKDA